MPVELMLKEAAAQPPRAPFVLKGGHVLAIMVAFFAVVASVNAVMMTMAIRTMPGLDARNGYEVSQRFNTEIARMGAQDRKAWNAELTVARTGGEAEVLLAMSDAGRMAVDDLSVIVRLLHPASRAKDREARLTSIGEGRYVARIADVAPGAWTVATSASRDGVTVFTSQNRVLLKE